MHDAPDTPLDARPTLLREVLLIGLGGALGSLARGLIGRLDLAGEDAPAFPAFLEATLLANTLGAFLLGLLLARRAPWRPGSLLRPFLAVGLLGSLTTWSTLAAISAQMLEATGPGPVTARLIGPLAIGLVAFALGDRLGRHAGPGDR